MMKLTVNGESYELPADQATVRDLVQHLNLGRAAVAVEVNRQVIPHKRHDQAALHEGDTIEVVSLVGGG